MKICYSLKKFHKKKLYSKSERLRRIFVKEYFKEYSIDLIEFCSFEYKFWFDAIQHCVFGTVVSVVQVVTMVSYLENGSSILQIRKVCMKQ